MTALGITDRELVYTVDPAVWGAQPHDYASIAAWHLGLFTIALEQAELAADKEPNEDRLRQNVNFIKKRLDEIAA